MVKGKRSGLTFTECSVKICITAILKMKGDAISKAFVEEYKVILVSGDIMKPTNIAKARVRMTSKNRRQFLIKTLECVMMAATNHSS